MSYCVYGKAPTVGFSDTQRPACGPESELSKDPENRMAGVGLLQGVLWPELLCLDFSPLFSALKYI